MATEEEKKPISTYYKDMLPELVIKYKLLIEQCFEIVDEPIDIEVSADKRHAELRSKRDAMTDAQHYAQQVDILENTINGVSANQSSEGEPIADEAEAKAKNWAKRNAKKPN